MADSIDAHMARNTAEAKDWEGFIEVVWLHDFSDIVKGALILIHTGTLIMKGLRTRWVTIASRVVDGSDHAYLPARAQVIDKTGLDEKLAPCNAN